VSTFLENTVLVISELFFDPVQRKCTAAKVFELQSELDAAKGNLNGLS